MQVVIIFLFSSKVVLSDLLDGCLRDSLIVKLEPLWLRARSDEGVIVSCVYITTEIGLVNAVLENEYANTCGRAHREGGRWEVRIYQLRQS